jgi:hypothetical protein
VRKRFVPNSDIDPSFPIPGIRSGIGSNDKVEKDASEINNGGELRKDGEQTELWKGLRWAVVAPARY